MILIDYFRRFFFFFSCVHSMTWRRFNWRVVEMLKGDLELQTTSFVMVGYQLDDSKST